MTAAKVEAEDKTQSYVDKAGMFDYSALPKRERKTYDALLKEAGKPFHLFTGQGNPRELRVKPVSQSSQYALHGTK